MYDITLMYIIHTTIFLTPSVFYHYSSSLISLFRLTMFVSLALIHIHMKKAIHAYDRLLLMVCLVRHGWKCVCFNV